MSGIDELAGELKARYERPGAGGKVVAIHLFGIERAPALETVSLSALLAKAGMPGSYKTEIRKGMRLAPYVTVRS